MNKIFNIFTVLALILSSQALAFEKSYDVVLNQDSSPSTTFSIGYTLGTHTGYSNQTTGTAVIQDSPLMISSTEIIVPISKISTDNDKRDCHLREALGLDYSVSSYPNAQVCDGANAIPLSGKDSIAFSEIKFNLTSLINSANSESLKPGVDLNVTAMGIMTLHGVTKEVSIPLTLTPSKTDSKKINVKGNFSLSISDYGIIVRKVLFVSVKDTANVQINLTLQEK